MNYLKKYFEKYKTHLVEAGFALRQMGVYFNSSISALSV
jgi:hypothetical protein